MRHFGGEKLVLRMMRDGFPISEKQTPTRLPRKSEKAELMETLAKQDSGEGTGLQATCEPTLQALQVGGFASEATSLHAESLEAAMKVRLLVQDKGPRA